MKAAAYAAYIKVSTRFQLKSEPFLSVIERKDMPPSSHKAEMANEVS